MKSFCAPNITIKGRLVRGLAAVGLLVGAGFAFRLSAWIAIPLLLAGGFTLFEAFRGWCALRACGIKTRL
jgi:hypothetical protein